MTTVVIGCLLAVATLALGAISSPASAVTGAYPNARIAATALTYWNGHNGAGSAPGSAACSDARNTYRYTADSGGQCRAFVNCVVVLASGGTQHVGGGSDYFAGFLNAGGQEVTDARQLAAGDIVQDGQGIHTFIIVSVQNAPSSTSATAMVVDSNHYAIGYANPAYPETVSYYSRQFTLDATQRAFRMGSVAGGSGSLGDQSLVVRQGTTLYGKAGLTDKWLTLTSGSATAPVVSGSRIAFRTNDPSHTLWVKDGITGTWYREATNVDSFGLAG